MQKKKTARVVTFSEQPTRARRNTQSEPHWRDTSSFTTMCQKKNCGFHEDCGKFLGLFFPLLQNRWNLSNRVFSINFLTLRMWDGWRDYSVSLCLLFRGNLVGSSTRLAWFITCHKQTFMEKRGQEAVLRAEEVQRNTVKITPTKDCKPFQGDEARESADSVDAACRPRMANLTHPPTWTGVQYSDRSSFFQIVVLEGSEARR